MGNCSNNNGSRHINATHHGHQIADLKKNQTSNTHPHTHTTDAQHLRASTYSQQQNKGIAAMCTDVHAAASAPSLRLRHFNYPLTTLEKSKITRRVRCSDAGSRDTTEADRATRPENPGLPPPATPPERPGLLMPPPRGWSLPRTSVNDPPFAQSFLAKNGSTEARKPTAEKQVSRGKNHGFIMSTRGADRSKRGLDAGGRA